MTPQSLLLVTGIGMNKDFRGDRYSLDKRDLLGRGLRVRNDGQKGWLPG